MVGHYEARKGKWVADYYFGQVVEQESSPPQVISSAIKPCSRQDEGRFCFRRARGDHTHTCCPHMSLPTHNAVSLQWLEETADYNRFAKYNEFERKRQKVSSSRITSRQLLDLPRRPGPLNTLECGSLFKLEILCTNVNTTVYCRELENTIILCD